MLQRLSFDFDADGSHVTIAASVKTPQIINGSSTGRATYVTYNCKAEATKIISGTYIAHVAFKGNDVHEVHGNGDCLRSMLKASAFPSNPAHFVANYHAGKGNLQLLDGPVNVTLPRISGDHSRPAEYTGPFEDNQ